jgi:hypothetical protein
MACGSMLHLQLCSLHGYASVLQACRVYIWSMVMLGISVHCVMCHFIASILATTSSSSLLTRVVL